MSVNTYPGFTPDASCGASFGTTSSAILLPGSSVSTDGLVLVANLGSWPVFVALGSSSVTATVGGAIVGGASPCSLAVQPGQSIFLARGTATYLAGIIAGGLGNYGNLNITTGN